MEFERAEARRQIGELVGRLQPGASLEVAGRIFEVAFAVQALLPERVYGATVEYLPRDGNYRLTKHA